VVDLKTLLDLPESGLTDLNKVIILRHADMEFGVLADTIVGGRWLPSSEAGTLTLLDVPALAGDPRFCVDAEVSA
jgi:purine-binding chemotaxis protein CheW